MSSPSPELECAQQDAVYKRAESQRRVAAAAAATAAASLKPIQSGGQNGGH